jgi:hypothetical protein
MAQYGVLLSTGPHDYNALSHVGWNSNIDCGKNNIYNNMFSQEHVNYISKTVTSYLFPLMNKAIVVPDEEIRGMITSVWNVEKGGNYADIYTEDTFNLPRDSYKRITEIVIQSITSQIKNTYEMKECNNSLDIWNQLYGDFNKAGLRAHPKIKLREKHPQYMAFNMNY